MQQNPAFTIYGPGVTQAADPSWLATFETLKSSYNFAFTVKSVIFNTTNNFTIADLLK